MAALSGPSFPSFADLPHENELDLTYYKEAGDDSFAPSRHWVLFGEITSNDAFMRPEVRLRTLSGEQGVNVIWYLDNGEENPTRGFHPIKDRRLGATLAIMYAHRKMFMDGTEGIRQESLAACYTFMAPLAVVRVEADKLLRGADVACIGGNKECFKCQVADTAAARHKKCGKCGRAAYCSVACQRAHWPAHKMLCGDAERLLRLAALPRRAFTLGGANNGFLTMDTLPPHAL